MTWHKVAHRNDIVEGEVKAYTLGKHMIALYYVGGEFYATSNICTHAFAMLHEGVFTDGEIECPLHQAIFDVRSGEALEGPADEDLQTFAVKVEGDDIWVDV